MPVESKTVSVNSTPATIVDMSVDGQTALIQNLEPALNANAMSRAGRIFLIEQKFDVANGATALFSIATGASGLQIQFYEIVSTESTIFAELVEGATVTTTGDEILGYNLNRNETDNYDSVFKAASAVTGGVTISAELVTATNQAGGQMQLDKIHTLRPNSNYGMKLANVGGKNTTVFLQIAFSEKYNGQTEVTLGDTVGDGYTLKGGEAVKMEFVQSQSLSAVSGGTVEVGILRQD